MSLVLASSRGDGNPEIFDADWRDALESGKTRWLSYPALKPRTQTELFERVKADQIDALLHNIGLRSGRVLEYACGAAGMSAYLAHRGFDSIALDLSHHALKLARRNAQLHAVDDGSLDLVGGDVFHLPFKSNSFDLVMSYGLLEHFTPERLLVLLAETHRVLRPGGMHVVDIIHGCLSVRTFATILNFSASAILRLIQGDSTRIGSLYTAYFERLYENQLTPDAWQQLFEEAGLGQVVVQVCRPFPPLALSGPAEQLYVHFLQALLPLWRWFDSSPAPGLRWLGWMYLVYGTKPTL